MKGFTLELIQGRKVLGAWRLGDEPITLRVAQEGKPQLEICIKSPEGDNSEVSDALLFEKNPDDDFTMPIPIKKESRQVQSLSVFNQPAEEKGTLNSYSNNVSQSLNFDINDFGDQSQDNEPMLDMVDFIEVDCDDDVEYIANPNKVLENLRQSLQIMRSDIMDLSDGNSAPPELPDIPSMNEIKIAVWKQRNGEWYYTAHLEAGNETSFKNIGIWVDNTAALLLTGSANIYILVKMENGTEQEYASINGALQLPSRATVLMQQGDDIICFRPE